MPYFPPASTSTTAALETLDENVAKGQTTSYNFIGAGVTATVSGLTASVTIPGGAGASPTQIEVDFGSFPTFGTSSVITDAGVSPTSKVLVWQAGDAPTGKGLNGDENEMDGITCSTSASLGSFKLFVNPRPGPIKGKFKFNYLIY